jgi:hypothetical protein
MFDHLRQAAQQVVSEQAEDEGLWFAAATASEAYLQQALRRLHAAVEQPPLPVQEPVACRFCHSEKGCWAWQCYHCGEIDDVQKPTPPAAQRTWVGLDEDDIRKLYGKDLNYRDGNYVRYAMAVEARLKEKNNV